MRVHGSALGAFVPVGSGELLLPWNPVTGMSGFIDAKFVVPQNPIVGAGLGEFVDAWFAVPQNPIYDAGLGDVVGTAAMYSIPQNSVLAEAQRLGLSGYDDCGCGCGGGGGCGGGLSGIVGDFSSWAQGSMIGGVPNWALLAGAGLVAFFLFVHRFGGYRSEAKDLKADYRKKLAELRSKYPTAHGRFRRAAGAF